MGILHIYLFFYSTTYLKISLSHNQQHSKQLEFQLLEQQSRKSISTLSLLKQCKKTWRRFRMNAAMFSCIRRHVSTETPRRFYHTLNELITKANELEIRPTIRRAFIFCLYCGLRFCDVKDLTYKNVDYANRLLKFEQSKTKGHSASSGVVIPLNDGLLSIIGEAPADKNCLIFDLPTYESCCKSVKRWVKRAGIDKHISWHCARHSFAVNILNNGANIKTVASLLGHSGLRHTEKYTRAVDKLKEEAINSLPELKF